MRLLAIDFPIFVEIASEPVFDANSQSGKLLRQPVHLPVSGNQCPHVFPIMSFGDYPAA
jgi:hypothetical protein